MSWRDLEGFDRVADLRRDLDRLLRKLRNGKHEREQIEDLVTRLEWLHVDLGRQIERQVSADERRKSLH